MAFDADWWLPVFVTCLATAACTGPHANGEDAIGEGQPLTAPATIPTVSLPERVPESAAPVTGEAPAELLARIRQDLAGRTGAAPASLSVVRDQSMTWNDGSLGCPIPGQVYTQALVAGYWIVLAQGGREYDYRCDGTGRFELCANPPPVPR